MHPEPNTEHRPQMEVYLSHTLPQSLSRLCYFISANTAMVSYEKASLYDNRGIKHREAVLRSYLGLFDLTEAFPILRSRIADIVRQNEIRWEFRAIDILSQNNRPVYILWELGAHRHVKLMGGILDGAVIGIGANLSQFPIKKLRYLDWSSDWGMEFPDDIHREHSSAIESYDNDRKVSEEQHIHYLSTVGVEELKLFPNMPHAAQVCQLIQQIKLRKLNISLDNLSKLINEVGASKLREQLNNVWQLAIHGQINSMESEWEFISSLPNLTNMRLWDNEFTSEVGVHMQNCFRKVRTLDVYGKIFPPDVMVEFQPKLTHVYVDDPLHDITEEYVILEDIECGHDITLHHFVTISALPNIKRIKIVGNVNMNKTETEKMADILSKRRFDGIQIYMAQFSPSQIRKIFRFQGEALEAFAMTVSIDQNSNPDTSIIHALYESAARWTPNLKTLVIRLLRISVRLETRNIISCAVRKFDDVLALRCPVLDSTVSDLIF